MTESAEGGEGGLECHGQYRNTWHGQRIVCGQLDVHVGQAVVQAWPCQSLKF